MRLLGIALIAFFTFVLVTDPIYYGTHSEGHVTGWHIFHHTAGFFIVLGCILASYRWLVKK